MDKYKILYVSDIHIPMKTKRSKNDLDMAPIDVLEWINNTIIENNINILVLGGDLFDRGVDNENIRYINLIDHLLINISKSVQYIFMTMGNHELSYYKNNPTFKYLDITDESVIEQYKNKEVLKPINKIIKVVPSITIGSFDLYFHHFNKEKSYVIPDDKTKDRFVISFYHDDIITFESKENLYHHKMGYGIKSVNTNIFNGVDIAILGHIHTPLEPIKMNNIDETVVITPGSMIRNNSAENHKSVKLPIITISENIEETNIEYIEYVLPKYEEEFNLEVIEKLAVNQDTRKILNNDKLIEEAIISRDDITKSLGDIDLIKLYNESDKFIETESMKLWKVYYEETNNCGGQ